MQKYVLVPVQWDTPEAEIQLTNFSALLLDVLQSSPTKSYCGWSAALSEFLQSTEAKLLVGLGLQWLHALHGFVYLLGDQDTSLSLVAMHAALEIDETPFFAGTFRWRFLRCYSFEGVHVSHLDG